MKKPKEKLHEKTERENSFQNPVIFPATTTIFQPNGLPFNAQKVVNLNQAKILVSIVEALQGYIIDTIQNERFRSDPQQLSIFEEPGDNIQLDFKLSSFGVDNTNYRKLKEDIVAMKNFLVIQDTVYFNKNLNQEVEAEEVMSLISSVLLPKKFDRHISIKINKKVATSLVNVGNKGYTKYLLEVAMETSSKYTLLIYQLISRWKDKGGFSWTIENFRKQLGLTEKYESFRDLNKRVLLPAYRELFERADLWFEYNVEKKDGVAHLINFKIVKGYVTTSGRQTDSFFETDKKITKVLEITSLKQQEALFILRDQLLISNVNLLGEIIGEKLDDFYKWWNINKTKLEKQTTPSSLLLYFLKMTKKQGWIEQSWAIENIIGKHKEKWKDVCDRLLNFIDKSDVKNYYCRLSVTGMTKLGNGTTKLTLSSPNRNIVEYIERHHLDKFKSVLIEVFGPVFIEYAISS